MTQKHLFVVAGPNGSGKSLFSKELTISDYEVFDGDKHMSALVKQFPETGSESLWSYINEEMFFKSKQEAIKYAKNYAYETNFSSDDPLQSVREFKKAGYTIHLIFMGLNSLEESIQRVAYRVKLGGHKVSEDSIRYNYEHGFKNLYKHCLVFDTVTLFDNAIGNNKDPDIPSEILYIVEGNLHLQTEVYPAWVKPVINLFKKD